LTGPIRGKKPRRWVVERTNTAMPAQILGTEAGRNGNGINHSTTSPPEIASAKARGGRMTAFDLSSVPFMSFLARTVA
jgi:hypothetical protein